MQDLISVIVPIYNVEKYLERCIQSIQNQTYTNLEIILVDDGSPDKCGEICDRYAALDDRIKVIHKPNGGVSDARNVGLNSMTGKYLTFIDPDDYVHPQLIEILFLSLQQKDAQVSVISWIGIGEDEQKEIKDIHVTGEMIREIDGRDLQNVYFNQTKERITYTVPWGKLYKSDVFNGIKYPVGKIHEDEHVTYKLLYNAKKIVYINQELYFYLTRSSSIMGDFKAKRFDIFSGYLEKINFYMGKSEFDYARKTLLLAIHMLTQYYKWINKKDTECLKAFKENYDRCKQVYIKNKNILKFSKVECIELIIYSSSFSLYRFIWGIKKKIG